jgi:hypothetical protein
MVPLMMEKLYKLILSFKKLCCKSVRKWGFKIRFRLLMLIMSKRGLLEAQISKEFWEVIRGSIFLIC